MTDHRFNKTILMFAPLAVPAIAFCGGATGALSGGSFSLLAEPGIFAFLVGFTLVGGVPIGLLFWAMKDTSDRMRAMIVTILLFVCVLAFFVLFIPFHGLANL